jgi:3-oxoacyl-[acyl-carrier-protein] synthase-1
LTLYLPNLGIVSALGNSPEQVLANALRGSQDGLRQIPHLAHQRDLYFGEVETKLPPVPAPFSQFDCRNNRILLAAYQQIETQVQALISSIGPSRIGVVLGSSTSGIREVEDALSTQLETGDYPPDYYDYKQEIGTVAEFLATYLGLTNVAVTVSTACSSSGKVFYTARNFIESGLCDAVLVGGADSLCRLTANGFAALGAVSATRSNPFSLNRDGINIGEGAALFILSKIESGIALKGVGESSDAYHISAPHPEGLGAELSMRAALSDARLNPQDISYLNLHGTGTPQNDLMESRAVSRVFGSALPCSSTKAMTGHTLGAAGAIELGLCWLALSSENKDRSALPHVWDGVEDPELEPLHLVRPDTVLSSSPQQNFISNSFAFGGSNVSVIIGTV